MGQLTGDLTGMTACNDTFLSNPDSQHIHTHIRTQMLEGLKYIFSNTERYGNYTHDLGVSWVQMHQPQCSLSLSLNNNKYRGCYTLYRM